MIITTEAIVLHSRKYSDSSNIVSLYTREQGKMSVIAKGSRKPKSKFGSAIMPLSIINATYYFKAGRELQTLSDAEVLLPLRTYLDSYEHLSTGLALVESVSATQVNAEQNNALYELLKHSLVHLNAAGYNLYSYFAAFNLHLAEIMGFMIDFSHCAETQVPIVAEAHPEYYFSFADGAPYSPHEASVRSGYRLRGDTIAILQRIAATELSDVQSISINEQQRSEIQHFFTNYFSFHLERRFVYRTERMVLGE